MAGGRGLLIAGGYGGATATVAKRLRPQDFSDWVPEDYPRHAEDGDVRAALDAVEADYASAPSDKQLDEALLRVLATSHRPADIATATVQLLSQLHYR